MSGEEETVDLSFLTEMEKESILGVLQRDKTLREMEAQRVRRLRRELERLREKGAARGQGRGQQALVAVQSAGEGVPDGSCARCLQPLGWAWLAGGDLCPACLQRVCRACRVPAKGGGGGARAGGGEWQCEACHREAEIRTASGEWFRQARAERFSCAASDGSDIVTASLRRRQKKKREAAGDIFLESHARAPEQLAKPNNGLAVGTPTATRSASKKPADNTKSYGLSRKPSKSRNKRGDEATHKRGDEATHGVLHHDTHAAKERSDPKADSVGKAAPLFTGGAASRAEHSPSANPSDAAPGGRGNVIVATAAAGIAAAPPTLGGSVPTAGSLLPPPDGISLGSRGSPPRRRDGTRTDSNGNRVSSSSPSSSGFPSPPASRLATTSTLSPPNRSPGPKMEGPARGKETSTRSPQGSRVGGKSSSESPHPPSASVSSPSTVSWGSSDAPAGASPVPASPARSIPSIGTPEHKTLSNTSSLLSTTNQLTPERMKRLTLPDHDGDSASLCSSSSLCSDTDAPPRSSGGAARVSGDINFSVSYDYRVGVLSLTLRQCRNLAYGEERTKRCDPYVKVYLLPDKSRQGKRKTKIKKNTINPVFNETLKYAISHTQLEVRCVQLSVWHHDSFRHNSFLGQASLPLDCCDLERGDDRWCALQPRVENITEASPQYKGELILALKYIAPAEQPQPESPPGESPPDGKGKGKRRPLPTGELHINIKGAKNLTAAKAGRTSNPFVKGYLLPDEHKVTKQKTPVVRKTVNPVWNHTFIFEGLPVQELPEVSLELTLWDHESLSSNHFLGGVRLGTGTGFSYERVAPWNDARGDEQAAFLRIAETPGVWVPVALMLRANMEARAF
ncbi:synaptotagmin-like protein 5 isoform X3 [Lampetra fluviatilis]